MWASRICGRKSSAGASHADPHELQGYLGSAMSLSPDTWSLDTLNATPDLHLCRLDTGQTEKTENMQFVLCRRAPLMLCT